MKLGIDCGGLCGACIEFDISTDKVTYDYGEDVLVTILSRADSEVNLTLLRGGVVVGSELITAYSPGYPIFVTSILENADDPGSYTINGTSKYMNNIENDIVRFSIDVPEDVLYVSINANKTTINTGETVMFIPEVMGNTGTVTYKWDFNNDGTIESYSSTTTRTYNTNGTYDVKLTVEDDSQTAND